MVIGWVAVIAFNFLDVRFNARAAASVYWAVKFFWIFINVVELVVVVRFFGGSADCFCQGHRPCCVFRMRWRMAHKTIGTILADYCFHDVDVALSPGLGAQSLLLPIRCLARLNGPERHLLYLGISTWRNAKQAPAGVEVDTEVANAGAPERAESTDTTTFWTLFRKGLMVGLGNPKDLLFFSALFPQFMDASALWRGSC